MFSTEVALSFISKADLNDKVINRHVSGQHWVEMLGKESPLATVLEGAQLTSLYFGSEFCEFLLPNQRTLYRGLELAQRNGLDLALVTPLASDVVIDQLRVLLPSLPQGSEVIVNDWGLRLF